MTTIVAKKRTPRVRSATIRGRVPHSVEVRRGPGGRVEMIELTAYTPNPLAPTLFVNKIGGVYRRPGGIIQVTFASEYSGVGGLTQTVQAASLLWPEHDWHEAGQQFKWIYEQIAAGHLSGVPDDGGGRRSRTQ